MNEVEMSQYIPATFNGVDYVTAMDSWFFFYNPDPTVPPDHRFPFATIVTTDVHDPYSDLNRPDVFRLNIGVSKETFRSLFGTPKLPTEADSSSDYDFAALNTLLPHPVYGKMYWVCILNPDDEMLATKVMPLLNEAYEMAVSKYDK